MDSKIKITTLGELGAELPMGGPSGGRKLSRRRWRTGEERALARLQKPKMSMGEYVGLIVAFMCTTFGDLDEVPNLESDQKALRTRIVALNRYFSGDVFYAYVWLRREVISKELELVDIACPKCEFKSGFVGDLDSVEVRRVDDPEEALWTYALSEPVTWRNERVVSVQLQPPTWQNLLDSIPANGNANETIFALSSVRGCIVGYNDVRGADGRLKRIAPLTDAEVDEFERKDFESLTKQIGERQLGAVMQIETVCPNCEHEFKAPIDWRYGNFFRASSPS